MGNHPHNVGKLFNQSVYCNRVLQYEGESSDLYILLALHNLLLSTLLRLCPVSEEANSDFSWGTGEIWTLSVYSHWGQCPHHCSGSLLIRDSQESWRGQWRSVSKGRHIDLNWPLGHRAQRSQLPVWSERTHSCSHPAWTYFSIGSCYAWDRAVVVQCSLSASGSRCSGEGCAALCTKLRAGPLQRPHTSNS